MTEIEATVAAPEQPLGNVEIPDAAEPAATTEHTTVIRPTSGWRAVNWGEMYEYRELLGFLIWRDVAARYKQTMLGPAWAIVQPLIMLGIFTLVASMMKVPMSGGIPAPVAIFAALIPWSIFSQGMPAAANSLTSSLNMVTKVYFPRLFLPITGAAVFLVDGLLTSLVFGLLLLFYRIPPHWTVVFLPIFFALTLIASLGIGCLLAAVTVFFRDIKHIVPFLTQIMMYVTPVFYTIDPLIPPRYRWFMSLNPMFGITDGFRAVILGLPIQWGCLLISSGMAIGLFIFALYYFRRSERLFADYV